MKQVRFSINGTPVYTEAYSPQNGFDLPIVRIESDNLYPNVNDNSILPLTIQKNPVPANGEFDEGTTIEFTGNGVHFKEKVVISYQGQATLGNPKKGFSIDTENSHKFLDWRNFDSFHLKAYYQDWEHVRDTTANRIWEQMLMSNGVEHTRPYMGYNDFNNDIRQRIDAGSFCHVDGFPVELYINDVYWGLYTWRLKKHKDVYMMDKKNAKHIMLDEEWLNANFNNGFPWTYTEIRYPKGLKCMDGTDYDGDDPKEIAESDTKTNILAFYNSLFVNSQSLTKSDFEAHLNVNSMIDLICHHDFCCVWDSISKNTLYCTWDGVHWSVCPYDMDSCFGIYYHNHTTWVPVLFQPDADVLGVQAYDLPWFGRFESLYADDIKARYAELRSTGVFTAENVCSIMSEWIVNVGFDVYKRDTTRWSYPTNGSDVSGSIKDSVKRVYDFVVQRLVYLDNKYNYSSE